MESPTGFGQVLLVIVLCIVELLIALDLSGNRLALALVAQFLLVSINTQK
jgi:hypothetical protein